MYLVGVKSISNLLQIPVLILYWLLFSAAFGVSFHSNDVSTGISENDGWTNVESPGKYVNICIGVIWISELLQAVKREPDKHFVGTRIGLFSFCLIEYVADSRRSS